MAPCLWRVDLSFQNSVTGSGNIAKCSNIPQDISPLVWGCLENVNVQHYGRGLQVKNENCKKNIEWNEIKMKKMINEMKCENVLGTLLFQEFMIS